MILPNKKCYLNVNINIFGVFTSNSGSRRPGVGSMLSKLKDDLKICEIYLV